MQKTPGRKLPGVLRKPEQHSGRNSGDAMSAHIAQIGPRDLTDIVRVERQAFAAKIRMTRAAIGWSQSEFAFRVGLTQRSVHKLEQGETDPRRATVRAIEQFWKEQGIDFEDLADGGFRVVVRPALLEGPVAAPSRRRHSARIQLGVTSIASRAAAYRS
jgi:transcriptional regulator with XRE-family HTH domain